MAVALVSLAKQLGTRTTAFLTKNDSPIGLAVGNSLEIAECIECLRYGSEAKAKDVIHLVATFGGHLLYETKQAETQLKGQQMITEALNSGKALKCFREKCIFHGVEPQFIDLITQSSEFKQHLPSSSKKEELRSRICGRIKLIDARTVGVVLQQMGAGRLKSSDIIDPSVGLELNFAHSPITGQYLAKGQVWGYLHHNGQATAADIDVLEQSVEYFIEQNDPEVTEDVQYHLEQMIVDII